jgi:hypothetical protein
MSRTFPVSIRRENAADHAPALGMTGLLTKPSFRLSKMFDPTERSSGPSSAVLILDPCSSLRSFIDWQACWRLRRAGAIETGLFEMQGELLPAGDPKFGLTAAGSHLKPAVVEESGQVSMTALTLSIHYGRDQHSDHCGAWTSN